MYDFEYLNHITIYVSPEHKFGADSFLLSDFAQVRRRDKICDLGTGCGIIALLWFRYPDTTPNMVYAVDIQSQAIEQLNISISENKLTGKIKAIAADLKCTDILKKEISDYGNLDIVVCNPPYKAMGAGVISEMDSEKIARHESMCNIDDVCSAAAGMLRFGGKLCLCQRPERLADVILAMRNVGIEPKVIQFVQQKHDKAPWLFLIEGKKGSKPFLKVIAPYIVEVI